MFTKNNKTPAAPPPEPPQKPVPAQDAIRGAASKPAARAASIICADMKINGSVASEGALQILWGIWTGTFFEANCSRRYWARV